MYSHAPATLEMIMLKQHVLFVPQFSFSSSDYLHALIGVGSLRDFVCMFFFFLCFYCTWSTVSY